MIRVKQIPHLMHGIEFSEIAQIFKLFGHWPVPQEDVIIPGDVLCAIWLADYVATMGILDQGMRANLLEQLKPRISGWGADGPNPTPEDDCCIRLADRKFLFFEDGHHMDLMNGAVFTGLPKVEPVDKLILNLHALYHRRGRDYINASNDQTVQ